MFNLPMICASTLRQEENQLSSESTSDDFVIAGESSERIEQVKTSLSEKFDIKDLGELHYFLGVQVVQDHKRGTVWMGQPTFTEFVLQKYSMSEAKSVKTPVSVNSKLVKASEECELVDQVLYQSAVGSLLYLATRSRPDIAFAVNNVSAPNNTG